MIKELYKLMYSTYRATRNHRNIKPGTYERLAEMFADRKNYPTASDEYFTMGELVKRIIDEKHYSERSFVPKGYKSGDRIYVSCVERDCDLYESHYTRSFAGPFLFEKWYSDNREWAEGPLWLHYISKREYENFKHYGRDLAAEQMGY